MMLLQLPSSSTSRPRGTAMRPRLLSADLFAEAQFSARSEPISCTNAWPSPLSVRLHSSR